MRPADVTSGKLFDGVLPAVFDELEPGFSTSGNNIWGIYISQLHFCNINHLGLG